MLYDVKNLELNHNTERNFERNYKFTKYEKFEKITHRYTARN